MYCNSRGKRKNHGFMLNGLCFANQLIRVTKIRVRNDLTLAHPITKQGAQLIEQSWLDEVIGP